MRLILASASPRRAELLRAAGYDFEVRVADVDERVLPGESPRAYVRRLAHEKAARVFRMVDPGADPTPMPDAGAADDAPAHASAPDLLVLAADTAVVVDGEILGKPADAEDAARMIRSISGRRHEVLTGVAGRARGFARDLVESTTVEVVRLTDEQVAWYVGTGEGRDKAGAYAIQGLFSRFVAGIAGSYPNVVGLPIAPVAALIEAAAPGVRAVASGRY